MTTARSPFQLPEKMTLELDRVRDYWQSLLRGEANMPFWDDVKLSSLPDLRARLMLVDAFENPQRFRFNTVGQDICGRFGENPTGKFLDEIESKTPFEYLMAQSSATIEARAPTFYASHPSTGTSQHQNGYVRLLLPMWGNGRIEMMLGAIATR